MEVIVLAGNFNRAIFVSAGGRGAVFFSKKSKLGRFRISKPNFRRLSRENNMLTAFQQGEISTQLDWLAPLSCVVVNPCWERLKILQVIVILQWDLVLINLLSVTLEMRTKMLLKEMFKSLVMLCLIHVSLLSRQSQKC